jgi:hypothetical protein
MVIVSRRVLVAIAALAGAAGLWYLRDPAWLAAQTTGLRPWQQAADGTRFRWSGGHASFFVPSDTAAVRVPIATTFDAAGREPMVVTFTVDGVRAARALLVDEGWQNVTLGMPSGGSRRVRRIDVRTSVTREDNHGVRIGALKVSHGSSEWRPCCW